MSLVTSHRPGAWATNGCNKQGSWHAGAITKNLHRHLTDSISRDKMSPSTLCSEICQAPAACGRQDKEQSADSSMSKQGRSISLLLLYQKETGSQNRTNNMLGVTPGIASPLGLQYPHRHQPTTLSPHPTHQALLW